MWGKGGLKVKRPSLIRSDKQAEEFIKCSTNVFYFIINYVRIKHPTEGVLPFRLYDFQIACLKEVICNRFTVSLKPRQMGISTLMAAYLLWFAMFHPNKNILIISIKMNVAKSFLQKIKSMYKRLPEFLKMEIMNGRETGTALSLIFANGSEIHVSAATADAGRSEAISFLFLDEVAFQKNAAEIWGAAQPTLSTGGKACMVSTAYGMGNLFHDVWVNAVANLNGFFPIKLNWRMHPDRDEVWYNRESKTLGEKRAAQEIDCDFLKSGFNVFDLMNVKVIEERLATVTPYEVFRGGELIVYYPPNPEKNYVLGADIATGRARDYSAFSIMDYQGKEYACFKGKLDTRSFAHLLIKWGANYNGAMLAPESNSIGEGVISILQENYYPNIYSEVALVKKVDAHAPVESARYGWYTSEKSRNEMITGLDSDLIDDTVELCNPFFVQEAKTFVYAENGKPIALGKVLGKGVTDIYDDENTITYTDDSIFAVCIANQVRKRLTVYKGALPLVGG